MREPVTKEYLNCTGGWKGIKINKKKNKERKKRDEN